VLIAAAAYFAAPLVGGLLAGTVGTAAGGAAGVGATGLAGAAAGGATTAATTAASGGITGFLSKALASPLVGNALLGGAQGYAQYQGIKEQEKQQIRAENRRKANYEGAGAAASFDFRAESSGLGPQLADASTTTAASLIDPTEVSTGTSRLRRPSVVAQAEAPQQEPRPHYNPETGRIEYT